MVKLKIFTLLTLLIMLLGLTACDQTPAPPPVTTAIEPEQQEFAAPFEKANCPFELAKDATEGQDIVCGYVTVPEEHAHPDGPTIRLAVTVIKSTSDNPAPDPLVVEAGGPGVSTLASAPTLLGLADLRARSDIVLVEQRGTRYSEPFLYCEELLDAARETLARNPGDEEKASLQAKALTACRDHLTAQGINLSAYDSLENAADILMALTALGYEQFNLYGISYATKLAQHLVRDAPHRLRSVILDAVAPLPVDYVAQAPRSADRAFRQLFAACAADPACNTAYPDLEVVFFDLVDQLNENPVTVRFEEPAIDVAVTGDLLVWQLYQHLYLGQTIPFLPAFIYGLKDGDDALITNLGPQVLISTATNGMSYSVRCAEETYQTNASADYPEIPPQIAATILGYLDIREQCAVWNVEPLGDFVREQVVSDVPTLIMSGEFDPILPPVNGDLMAETLSNSYVYTFPGLGHGTFARNDCPNSILLDFVNDPTTAPDAACIAGMGVQFVVSTEGVELEPFTDDEFGISGVLPKGWAEVHPGVYLHLDDAGTPTLLEVVKLPDTPLDEQIASWLPTYGIDEFPESIGRRETAALTWDLYTFEANMPDLGKMMVDIAMAQTDAGVCFVGLYAPTAEHNRLYEVVFLPVVDALAAIE